MSNAESLSRESSKIRYLMRCMVSLLQAAACSTSGASCSKDVKDSSEEETTDEDEDSEDDEQWNSDEAENDELFICVVFHFRKYLTILSFGMLISKTVCV